MAAFFILGFVTKSGTAKNHIVPRVAVVILHEFYSMLIGLTDFRV